MAKKMNKTDPPRSGTKEWAVVNKNIQIGCEHNCRYCYARYNAVIRFGYCEGQDWKDPFIYQNKVGQNYRKYNGTVMFPSTHDITPRNLIQCLYVLTKLLLAGNRVLIVSKPHFSCVTAICDELKDYKHRILFRFTIGSTYDKVLEFWEPGAPNFIERISCLQYAKAYGFATSVACEPMLDPYVANLYEACSDFVTESFWIGKLRDFSRRVDLTGVTDEQKKMFVELTLLTISDEFIKLIYETMKDYPLIRWKDSIREVIPAALERVK